MKRYYKATDGVVTIFRQSASYYRSAWIQRYPDRHGPDAFGFSTKIMPIGGTLPVSEITKVEFDELAAQRAKRLAANGWPPNYLPPSQSWIRQETAQ